MTRDYRGTLDDYVRARRIVKALLCDLGDRSERDPRFIDADAMDDWEDKWVKIAVQEGLRR